MAQSAAKKDAPEEQAEEQQAETQAIERLHLNRRKHAEHAFSHWDVRIPAGTPREHLLDPRFWQYHAGSMKHLDQIRAIPDDWEWCAELIVTWADGATVRMQELSFVELVTDADMRSSEVLRVEQDLNGSWKIVRTADDETLKTGHRTKLSALREAETMARAHTVK